MKKILILILESELFEPEENMTKQEMLEKVANILKQKLYNGKVSTEIQTNIDVIINPFKAFNSIVAISNNSSYFITNNWLLERFFKPNQLKKVKDIYTYDTFTQIIENCLTHQNYEFLERFLKYSRDSFVANEETKTLYYTCSKLIEAHINNRNAKKMEKICQIIFNCIIHF